MNENPIIPWTDHTFNPWQTWGRPTDPFFWRQPLRWNRAASGGRPALVLCGHRDDVFEDYANLNNHRTDLFNLITHTPNLIWLLLTRQIHHAPRLLRNTGWITGGDAPDNWEQAIWTGPPNVWIGTIVEDQRVIERVPWLLTIPVPLRFVACLPLHGPVDLTNIRTLTSTVGLDIDLDALRGHLKGPDDIWPWAIDWVIAGSESGPNHRPVDPDWIRSLRDQCTDLPVGHRGQPDARMPTPFHFTQWGCATPGDSGGRTLDGLEHLEYPRPARRYVYPLPELAN